MFFWNTCFFYDSVDVGNFISGSSACSKCSLNVSKFSAYVLLKPSLENLEHYFANMCVECNCVVVWTYFGNDFLWNWVTDIFQFYGHCWVCQICWHIVFITFTPSSFRIWNSSTGIPPPPLALLIVILPEAHFTSHSRMSGTRWVITPSWSSGSWRPFFCIVLLCILATIIIQFSSVTQLCPTLWDPMNCKMPGLAAHHQLLEFTQTHVHWVGDAIQPSHPLSFLSPPAFNLSQHRGLFKWVSSSHQVAKVLEFQLQHLSLQWTPRTDLL